MPWPDIFFKAKPAPKREGTSAPATAADKSKTTDPQPVSIPGTGGTVSRVPARVSTPAGGPTKPIQIIQPQPDLKKTMTPADTVAPVSQAMAEADTLRAMTRSGGVRLIKRSQTSSQIEQSLISRADASQPPPFEPQFISAGVSPAADRSANTETGAALSDSSTEKPSAASPNPESAVTTPETSLSTTAAATGTLVPPGITIFRRKAKMTDVARIILPAKREEAKSAPFSSTPQEPLQSAGPESSSNVAPALTSNPAPSENLSAPIQTPNVSSPESNTFAAIPEPEKKSEPNPAEIPISAKTEDISQPSPFVPTSEKAAEPHSPSSASPDSLKSQKSSASIPVENLTPAVQKGSKREFVLTNGERVMGNILSETSDSIYIDHATLGVLTIPLNQIAKRPIEVILINGDRVIGDLIAETSDCILVRHASLGTLTIPHSQRSSRVIEAVLKDGDRILGEVLTETETHTVIRSATLGTVTVQHSQVAMLNRKIEQMPLKALPPGANESGKKSSS